MRAESFTRCSGLKLVEVPRPRGADGRVLVGWRRDEWSRSSNGRIGSTRPPKPSALAVQIPETALDRDGLRRNGGKIPKPGRAFHRDVRRFQGAGALSTRPRTLRRSSRGARWVPLRWVDVAQGVRWFGWNRKKTAAGPRWGSL